MRAKILPSFICLVLSIVVGCGGAREKRAQTGTDVTRDAAEAAPGRISTLAEPQEGDPVPMAFGQGGQIKMLYDRRQRPQSVCLNGKVHLVFNGGGQIAARPKARTQPMAVTYDPVIRQFSEAVTLGPGSRDHHYGPILWADQDDHLHVLFGCHRTCGTHLVSRQPGSIGSGLDSWSAGAQIAPGISYPSAFGIYDGRELIYYRTEGHTSSWTYRITGDQGRTWTGPARDVTDMDGRGRTEWASYHTELPSSDGQFLHVAFIAYDDNKSNDPKRFYNPRYNRAVSNGWKYNLYYIKIELKTHRVTNFDGERMHTPIDIDQADAKCRIWDTQWRGAGVPPTIALDENAEPAFLHVLSEETLNDHRYYFIRRAKGTWKRTPIAHSNHQWNSCHLARDKDGTWHAYLIVGDGYLDTGRYMDRYGGGHVEEWTSCDHGNNWNRQRDLTPEAARYPGWKYNNIQPVTRPDGSVVEGMLLFYGWEDEESPEARAFLLHEDAPGGAIAGVLGGDEGRIHSMRAPSCE